MTMNENTMITSMSDLSVEALFAFAQPEDYSKLGISTETNEVDDIELVDQLYYDDMEAVEQEDVEMAEFFVQHGARAERRRRTRNHKASVRRVFARIYGISDMEAMEDGVKAIILKTPPRIQSFWHSESNWWREDRARIEARATRREMTEIRQTHLGSFMPEEDTVQEEPAMDAFKAFKAKFSYDEKDILAKAAEILDYPEEWLMFLAFEKEEFKKRQEMNEKVSA